jgi:hypothetical protein
LRDAGRSRKSAVVVLIGAALIASMVPAPALAHDPPGISRFLYALGQVESGGSYTAYNSTSGAYGKYQIMPSNWRAWALKYLGSSSAPQTPTNQEKVARAKVHDLYWWLGSWPVVAHWWLTGSSDPYRANWSLYSRRYVDKVMAIYNASTTTTSTTTVKRVFYQETSRHIAYTGTWRDAPYSLYQEGHALWTNTAGHTATFTFTGSAAAWYGPKGPTRGKARIYVDGAYLRTIDLYAPGFQARNTILSLSWAASGPHAIRVQVVGTPGRPTVAIDAFSLTP